MECDEQSIVVLHGGGMFESKKNTLARIEETYNNLPEELNAGLFLKIVKNAILWKTFFRYVKKI